MSILYSAFPQTTVAPDSVASDQFDLFISARNESDRVKGLFEKVQAGRKIWFEHLEYGLKVAAPEPGCEFVRLEADDLVEQMLHLVSVMRLSSLGFDSRLGIDITGFLRMHLMVLLRLILESYDGEVVLYYSDPETYQRGSKTEFSSGPIVDVVGVPGFEGVHENGPDAADLLIIGASYDHRIVRRVAASRLSAQHRLVWGLPSLQPHMYSESQLQVARARESINGFENERISLYAPAGDPFVTAQILSAHIRSARRMKPDLNVYLSPTGTKPQVVGFVLFALLEQRDEPTSVVYAPSEGYSSATATGWARSHRFELSADLVAQIRKEAVDRKL